MCIIIISNSDIMHGRLGKMFISEIKRLPAHANIRECIVRENGPCVALAGTRKRVSACVCNIKIPIRYECHNFRIYCTGPNRASPRARFRWKQSTVRTEQIFRYAIEVSAHTHAIELLRYKCS